MFIYYGRQCNEWLHVEYLLPPADTTDTSVKNFTLMTPFLTAATESRFWHARHADHALINISELFFISPTKNLVQYDSMVCLHRFYPPRHLPHNDIRRMVERAYSVTFVRPSVSGVGYLRLSFFRRGHACPLDTFLVPVSFPSIRR